MSRLRRIPPTTACGATSVFETPSVLRESLPSYSAKPGAFYAPRALRWTTPPRGRTDPFQGPKIKPMFRRFSMLLQDDLGVENGGQNGGNIGVTSSPGAFRDAPGARLPGDAVWGCILDFFGDPPNSENRAPRHIAGSISAKYADRAQVSKIDPDPILVPNRGQKPPRSHPDGFERYKTAAISC